MTPSAAPAITNYTLSKAAPYEHRLTIGSALRRLAPLMAGERRRVAVAGLASDRFLRGGASWYCALRELLAA